MDKNNIFITASASLVAITILIGAFLISTNILADDVVDNVSIEVPVSCTMSGSGMTTHNAEIVNGTYQANIGTTTMNVLCNDNAGFSVYAIGLSNDEYGNTKLIGASTNQEIATGTATTAGNPDVSNWAMKLAIDSQATYPITLTTGYDAFHAVPSEYTKVANRLSGTDAGTGATGASLTSTYAAYISKTQSADTYSGKVKFVLVHPNDGAAPVKTFNMQDVRQWRNQVSIGEEVNVIDLRDGKKYTASKLVDGNIWMTQNLNHDIVTDGSVVYDSTTTDLPIGTTWTPMRATSSDPEEYWPHDNSQKEPYSFDPGDLYWDGVLEDETPVSNGNPHYHLGNYYNWIAAVAMNSSNGLTSGYVDVDQSICPAGWKLPLVAANSQIESINYLNSFHALMEKFGYNSGQYGFDDDYRFWDAPLYLNFSGTYQGGEVDSLGYEGGMWSSTAINGWPLGPYYMESDFSVLGDNFIGTGYSVRCVAIEPQDPLPTISDVTYMQDFASMGSDTKSIIFNSMAEETEYQIKDKRDEKTYTIAKLKDGNIWMTQNLDLDIDSTKTYTPIDTNVSNNWTPSVSTKTLESGECNYQSYTPESCDPGDKYWSGLPNDSFMRSKSLDNIHYHLGNYYNWTAAIATNDSSNYGIYNDETGEYGNLEANQSICPAGWTLPKGGDIVNNPATGTFQYLVEQYGWTEYDGVLSDNKALWEAPFYYVISGNFQINYGQGIIDYIGRNGGVWSSSAVDDPYSANKLYIDRYGDIGVYYEGRDSFYPIRCIVSL